MIYRILADSATYVADPVTDRFVSRPSGTHMRGVFMAGVSEGTPYGNAG